MLRLPWSALATCSLIPLGFLAAPQHLLAQAVKVREVPPPVSPFPATEQSLAEAPRERSGQSSHLGRAGQTRRLGAVQAVQPRQLPHSAGRSGSATALPHPNLRPAGHHAIATQPAVLPSEVWSGGRVGSTAPAHEILRAPRIVHAEDHAMKLHHHKRSHLMDPEDLPPLIHQQAPQPPPAVIPDAVQREIWKTPYSYGYFGTTGSRQWVRHYGYRDRDREWRLRW